MFPLFRFYDVDLSTARVLSLFQRVVSEKIVALRFYPPIYEYIDIFLFIYIIYIYL